MQTAKQAADAVIPNEYGIDPPGKLRIGSKICCNLLGKVLADLANMREESLATAVRAPTHPRPHAPLGVLCSYACPASWLLLFSMNANLKGPYWQ